MFIEHGQNGQNGQKCNRSPKGSVTFSVFFSSSLSIRYLVAFSGLVVWPSRVADTGEKARIV